MMSSPYDASYEELFDELIDMDPACDHMDTPALGSNEMVEDNYGAGTPAYNEVFDAHPPELHLQRVDDLQKQSVAAYGPSRGDCNEDQWNLSNSAMPDYLDPVILDVGVAPDSQPGGPIGDNTHWPDEAICRPRMCPWAECSESCSTDMAYKTHIDDHLRTSFKEAGGAATCSWPNCKSKATFKTANHLAEHMRNIHLDPLLCSVPSCSYKKPFGRQADLERHHRGKHGNADTQVFKCPVEDCDTHETGFKRKDKMLQHVRENHPLLKCPYNHCSAEVVQAETESHLKVFHGDYECEIGGCESTHKSCFNQEGLERHLRCDHSMSYDAAYAIVWDLAGNERTARLLRPRALWQACKSCSTRQ